MTRRRAVLTACRHILAWPLPHPAEPALTGHPWLAALAGIRRGPGRWVIAGTWAALGLATSGMTLLWPLRRAMSTPHRPAGAS